MKLYLHCICALFLLVNSVLAQDQPDLTNPRLRVSYALGMDVVRALKADDFAIDLKLISAGMADTQAGRAAFTPEELRATMKAMQEDVLARAVAKKEAAGELHKKEGTAFLAQNAKKPGVQIKEVVGPDGEKVQLQYKVLKSGAGKGPSPRKTDTVVVRYRGTLIDGTPFDLIDPAAKDGDLATLSLSDVIPGWAEALQMMKVGDKWQLFVPPNLAYADFGPPQIGMHRTLIYELELVAFSASGSDPAPGAASSGSK